MQNLGGGGGEEAENHIPEKTLNALKLISCLYISMYNLRFMVLIQVIIIGGVDDLIYLWDQNLWVWYC